jgi:hypothetical protein
MVRLTSRKKQIIFLTKLVSSAFDTRITLLLSMLVFADSPGTVKTVPLAGMVAWALKPVLSFAREAVMCGITGWLCALA